MSIIEAYDVQEGLAKYIRAGAIPTLNNVQWTDEDMPRTDGETIYLPKINANATANEVLLYRYKAEHELGHEDAVNSSPHWKSVMNANMKEVAKDDALKFIWNLLSDFVQERNRVGKYVGRDDVLLRGREVFLATKVFPSLRGSTGTPMPDDMRKATDMLNAMFLLDNRNRAKWNPHITDKTRGMPKALRDNADMLDPIVDWATLRNEQDCLDAARKLRAAMDLPPPEEDDGNGDGDGGETDGEGKDSKGKSSKAGHGKPTGGASAGAMNKAAKDAIAAMEGHLNRKDRMPYTTDGKPKDPRKGSTYILRQPVPLPHTARKSTHARSHLAALVHRSTLPAQVRRYFMSLKRDKWDTGYRSGRLDTARLPDVLRGRDDVFRRAHHRITINSAVSLLVDCSASMNQGDGSGSSYINNAMASAYMLAEALAGIGVNVEINGFTEHDSNSYIYHNIKRYDQRWNPNATLDKMAEILPFLCQNPDGEAILKAYSDLRQRLEPRKVLIVLSDGLPEGFGHIKNTMGIDTFTRRVVNEIQADKNVALFCIGLGEHNPEKVGFNNCEHARDTKKLGNVLLNLVKRAIR